MKIKVLDRKALGEDTPLEALLKFGEVEIYDSTSPFELEERCKDADILIINKIKMTESVIRNSKNLKLICVFATGFDNIDLKTAKECSVAVANVPGYSTDSVALFTLSTVLSLFTHLREYNKFVCSGEYSKSNTANRLTPVYHEIKGKTWGIIGYGNIGKAVGKVAEALGCKLLVNKKTKIDGVRCVDIDTLCKESDIITIHCPLNSETKNLIDKNKIQLMKETAIVVNEARGAVINEYDIANAITNCEISGFGCDVYSEEPFSENHPFYKIKDLDNVLLTPHSAWGAYESRERCINIICENIEAYLSGKIKNRVDI